MATSPIRLNPKLISDAHREGLIQKRSIPKQIEYWAEIGRAVERVVDLPDIYGVLQGIKQLKIEDIKVPPIETDELFEDLQQRINNGQMKDKLTSAQVYYEASKEHPGLLDRIDSEKTTRETGHFSDGQFKVLYHEE